MHQGKAMERVNAGKERHTLKRRGRMLNKSSVSLTADDAPITALPARAFFPAGLFENVFCECGDR
jgi:hypothetical protein